MYIIKYDDDWEKFKEYLEQKMRYVAERRKEQVLQTFEQQTPLGQQTAQQAVSAQQGTEQGVSAQRSNQQETPLQAVSYEEQVLRSASAEPHVVADPSMMKVMEVSGESGRIYTFKAYADDDMYTAIAKMYPPGDTPEELGKFRVVEVEGQRVIVSKEPLNLDEFFELYKNTSTGFEAYIEDEVWLVLPEDLDSLVRRAGTVKSYSRRAVHLASKNDDAEEEVLIELSEPYTPSGPAKLVRATIKAHVWVYARDPERLNRLSPELLDAIYDIGGSFCKRRLNYRAGVGSVVAEIAGMCLESDVSPSLVIESRGNIDDNDVNEIEKALMERLQPLGLSITKRCSGGRYERIYIEKPKMWEEVEITCVQ
jgi:hypothetical protein